MKLAVTVVAIVSLCLVAGFSLARPIWVPVWIKIKGPRTVDEVVRDIGPDVLPELKKKFFAADVEFPPSRIALVATKAERQLELWASDSDSWTLISTFPILAASGDAGPKLVEGDRQVPEGFYRVVGLNPNSAYHLSMKINYPNDFDQEHARNEGRSEPGTNIFIHGKAKSIGCLAIGDPAIEELFTLVATVGHENVEVLIAPTDFRRNAPEPPVDAPSWLPGLYRNLEADLTGRFQFRQ